MKVEPQGHGHELQTAGHTVSTIRSLRVIRISALLAYSPCFIQPRTAAHGMVPPTVKVAPPISINLI